MNINDIYSNDKSILFHNALHLSYNNLTSLEGIDNKDFKDVYYIDISHNYISSLKELRCLKKLELLYAINNNIQSFEGLEDLNLKLLRVNHYNKQELYNFIINKKTLTCINSYTDNREKILSKLKYDIIKKYERHK